MKLALFQLDVVSGDVAENFHKVAMWIEKTAHDYAPDILVLPELWSTSYAYEILPQIADHNGTKTKAFLSELAKRHHVIVERTMQVTSCARTRQSWLQGRYQRKNTIGWSKPFAAERVPAR